MIFGANKIPDNRDLKEHFSWRATCVTDGQKTDLFNKFFTEIALKGVFPAYVQTSHKPEKNEEGKLVFPKETRFSYPVLKTQKGEEYFAVFTSREEMEKFEQAKKAGAEECLVVFDEFYPILASNICFDGIVINPFSDNFVLHRKVVHQWRQQKMLVIAKVKEAQEAKKAQDVKPDGE